MQKLTSAIVWRIGIGPLVLLGMAALGVACTSAQPPSFRSTLTPVLVPTPSVVVVTATPRPVLQPTFTRRPATRPPATHTPTAIPPTPTPTPIPPTPTPTPIPPTPLPGYRLFINGSAVQFGFTIIGVSNGLLHVDQPANYYANTYTRGVGVQR